jgi:hypothetical protein
MSQTFECANCGATLEYGGAEHTLKCPFCNSATAVPEELWRAAEAARQEVEIKQTQKKWGKYLLIFLAITVGLPTCLGLVGTLVASLLGFGGGLIGILAPFLAK